MKKKTKIIGTIGPASWSKKILKDMIDAGMNVARLNCSFANAEELGEVSTKIREISSDIAIMLDTKGPIININILGEEFVQLRNGDSIEISSRECNSKFWVSYSDFYKDTKIGQIILIDDGKLNLRIICKKGDKVIAKVIQGGTLKQGKSINIPNSRFNFPVLNEKDKSDIEYAVKNKYDYIAASFIRNAKDLKAISDIIKDSATKIIAKIENPEGVENFDEILELVDGIMIARGDLGVEIEAEKVPVLQKEFIKKCNQRGKAVIVATQMLESMVTSSVPTRAEISDIANAIYDGTDAVMLSEETAVGEHPVEAVKVMTRVAIEVEKGIEPIYERIDDNDAKPVTNAIARAVAEICDSLPIDKVLVATASGTTAIAVSRYRLKQPIYAFTKMHEYKRRLCLYRGVESCVLDKMSTTRESGVVSIAKTALQNGYVKKDDMVVIVSGSNMMDQGQTNMLEIQTITKLIK